MFNFFVGILSGIISGMGIGGGVVLIPALVLINQISQQTAQGINLLYFIPTAIVSLIIHIKNKNIEVKTAMITASAGLIGGVIGAFSASLFENNLLKRLFGFFLFGMGILEICRIFDKKSVKKG